MNEQNKPLLFAHIGDLHLTNAKEQNYKDLLSIIADIETGGNDKIDFVYLPGDNADHADVSSYNLLATALKMLSVPVHIISGDHDMEKGNLDNLYAMPLAQPMPFSINIKNTACLFLDMCGNGKGGPDFRLDEQQINWLKNEAEKATRQQQSIIIFMHTFPDDMQDETEKQTINQLITDNNVVLVDMGHTHYNEIANDGNTIFAATRSTGQIEEGPVGYSLISVYKNAVSWRFKLLDEPFPFVLITYPCDYRLATKQSLQNNADVVKAVVFADKKIANVSLSINNKEWMPMQFDANENCWVAPLHIDDATNQTMVSVIATDETGRPGIHTITYSAKKNFEDKNFKPGSDDYRIGAWAENHVLGTQLGPNRNAKPPKPPKK